MRKRTIALVLILLMLSFLGGFTLHGLVTPKEMAPEEEVTEYFLGLGRAAVERAKREGFEIENRTLPYFTIVVTFTDLSLFLNLAKVASTLFYSEEIGLTPRIFLWFWWVGSQGVTYYGYRVGG